MSSINRRETDLNEAPFVTVILEVNNSERARALPLCTCGKGTYNPMQPFRETLFILTLCFIESQNAKLEEPCSVQTLNSGFRVEAAFEHHGKVFLFGGIYAEKRVWMVVIDSRTRKILDGPLDSQGMTNYFNLKNVTCFCPTAAAIIQDRLFMFQVKTATVFDIMGGNFTLLSSEKFPYNFYTGDDIDPSLRVKSTNMHSVRSIMRYAQKSDGTVFKMVFKVVNLTHLPRIQENFFQVDNSSSIEYKVGGTFRMYSDELPELIDLDEEIALITTENSEISFGFQFRGSFSWPTFFILKGDEHEEIPLLNIRTNSIYSKFYNMMFEHLEQYLIPVEKWFGCPLDRHCLAMNINALTSVNSSHHVVITDKYFQFIEHITDELTTPRVIGELFTENEVDSMVKDVDSAFTDSVANVFLLEDTMMKKFTFKDGKLIRLSGGEIEDVLDETVAPLKTVYVNETTENYLYAFQFEYNTSWVFKYKYNEIRFQEAHAIKKPKFEQVKWITEINAVNPQHLDTVFSFDRDIYFIKNSFICKLSMNVFFKEAIRVDFHPLYQSTYFGCDKKANSGLAKDFRETYAMVALPKPFRVPPPTARMTTPTAPKTVTEDPVLNETTKEDISDEPYNKDSSHNKPLQKSEHVHQNWWVAATVSVGLGSAVGLGLGLCIYSKW